MLCYAHGMFACNWSLKSSFVISFFKISFCCLQLCMLYNFNSLSVVPYLVCDLLVNFGSCALMILSGLCFLSPRKNVVLVTFCIYHLVLTVFNAQNSLGWKCHCLPLFLGLGFRIEMGERRWWMGGEGEEKWKISMVLWYCDSNSEVVHGRSFNSWSLFS